MLYSKAAALAALSAFTSQITAHSWIEELTLIDPNTKTFTGTPGYARSFQARTQPGFNDRLMVHILPPGGDALEARDVDTNGVKPDDPMCRKSQQQQTQSPNYPRLCASPGSMVALRYEENGHVTLPQNQPGKPSNRGNVTIYGTTQPKTDEKFLDVFKQWNEAGTGGDKRGRLLVTQPYDDGQCYQVNGGQISTSRQQKYPHQADKTFGTDLACQQNIKLPNDIPTDKPYTLYWVWDWPTAAGTPGAPEGKAEIYTSCMDIDIQAGHPTRSLNEARDVQGTDYGKSAIPAYVASLKNAVASPAPAPQSSPATAPQSKGPSVADVKANAVQNQPPAASSSSPTPAAATPAPATEAPAASSPKPAAAPPASSAMALASAESLVVSALGSQLISQIAAEAIQHAAPTKTVTTTVNGGQASAAQTPVAAPNPPPDQAAAANSQAANPPAQPSMVTSYTGTSTVKLTSTSTITVSPTPANSVPASMPATLQMAPPLLSPTAAAAISSPAAAGAASGGASGAAGVPTFSGTATPVSSNAGSTATGAADKRSCQAGTCRKVKKSRIFAK